MKLLSVNVGRPRLSPGAAVSTGIYKEAVAGPIRVTPDGLVGDAVCDARHHGGTDQAVYAYGALDCDWWAEAQGLALAPGTFGENLTVAALESASLRIGDRLEVGEAVLEVTAPRAPCGTLAARMGDPGFVRRFRAAGRPGAYCRVIRPGVVRTGDSVVRVPYAGEAVTVLEMFRDLYASHPSEAAIRRLLQTPIAARARAAKEAQLATLLARHA